MINVHLFINGRETFGILFALLFPLAVAEITIIIFDILCRLFHVPVPSWLTIEDLYTVATLTGSLQTLLSLCCIGYQLYSGKLSAGLSTFSYLIEGFASTAFGVTLAVIGLSYNKLSHFTMHNTIEDHYKMRIIG
jgi:hypothetical protein